jgi:hypothetical protein
MADAPPARRTAARTVALFGAALVLLGAFTYVPLLDVPWIRSTAAPNLAAMILGTALGILGAARLRRRWPWILAVGESLMTLLFIGGIFGLMRLPAAPDALPVRAAAPDFTLPDQDGKPVTLSSFRSRGPVLLVFYRGFW